MEKAVEGILSFFACYAVTWNDGIRDVLLELEHSVEISVSVSRADKKGPLLATSSVHLPLMTGVLIPVLLVNPCCLLGEKQRAHV